MTLIANRDSETACVRFRDSPVIRSPDLSLQGVSELFSCAKLTQLVKHSSTTLPMTIYHGQSGDSWPAKCVMMCLHPPVPNSKHGSLSGPTTPLHQFRSSPSQVNNVPIFPPRGPQGYRRERFVSDQKFDASRERLIFQIGPYTRVSSNVLPGLHMLCLLMVLPKMADRQWKWSGLASTLRSVRQSSPHH